MFLKEKGIAHEFINEGPADAAGNVPRLNPFGKVPVLVRDDGEVLFESTMIVDYLDEPLLIPPAGDMRWRAQRWHALGQGLADAVVARLMETRRAAASQDPAVIRKQEAKVAAALIFAERHVPEHEFLVANQLTIADIALAVALGYVDLRYAHDWRSEYPGLSAWFSRFARRPSFVETSPS